MKIIPRVRPLDNHHEKIPSVIQITVAHWRFKSVSVFFDPVFQVNRRLHSRHDEDRIWCGAQRQTAALTLDALGNLQRIRA
jgi:hypothetical protein